MLSAQFPERPAKMSLVLPIDLRNPGRDALEQAAAVVRRGGVIVYPTETVYGIGADAGNAEAVARVVKAKRRTDGKPILVLVPSRALLQSLVREVSADAERLMSVFWPGPLTLVFRAANGIPPEITGGGGTIGIRVPSSLLCLRLLEIAGCPLTSTSANLSGASVARSVGEIARTLGEGVECYLDGGELPERKTSTILDVASDVPVLLREGAIPVAELRKVIPGLQAPPGGN